MTQRDSEVWAIQRTRLKDCLSIIGRLDQQSALFLSRRKIRAAGTERFHVAIGKGVGSDKVGVGRWPGLFFPEQNGLGRVAHVFAEIVRNKFPACGRGIISPLRKARRQSAAVAVRE